MTNNWPNKNNISRLHSSTSRPSVSVDGGMADVKDFDNTMEHTYWAVQDTWDALDTVQLERKRRIAGTREA